jgi:hypothetical protein
MPPRPPTAPRPATSLSAEGEATPKALIAGFGTIEDPHHGRKIEHRPVNILVIAACAVIGEAESFGLRK